MSYLKFYRYDGVINNSESARLFPERTTTLSSCFKQAITPCESEPTADSEFVVKRLVIFMGKYKWVCLKVAIKW